jgi:16S rRNA processing protein RimM
MGAEMERRVLVGRIVGVSGTAGQVKLESWTEPRMQIFRYQPWILKSAQTEQEISGCRGREQGKGMVAALPGVADREQAAALIGTEIWVPRSALPKPGPGEYYWADLEGMDVVNVEGVSFGQVSHLFATGANDVLVARDGGRERLIPWVLEQYIRQVDLEARRIEVDWDPEF